MFISAICNFVVLIICVINIIQASPTIESTLLQVHVVFRHGDRAPDRISMYPNDPHINDTWFPYGLGGLTNLGKKQEYELGKSLRKRYDAFLGDMYLPGIQEARSTSIPRAKISMQLVLAGLWPPNKQLTFVDGFPWQPIEYDYVPFEEDKLLGHPLGWRNCTNTYLIQYAEVESSDKVRNYLKENKEKIDYINTKSGLHIKTVFELMALYFGLYAEEHTNRTLPEWTKSVFPEFLEDSAKFCYQLQTATNEMLKSVGGPFVKKVLANAKDKITGKTSPDKKKIYLYSGHEINIAFVLSALKCYKPHIPQYASHIIFELHKADTKYGFKVFYQDTKQEEPQLLVIPGCEQFCPIDKFESLMTDVMPESSSIC